MGAAPPLPPLRLRGLRPVLARPDPPPLHLLPQQQPGKARAGSCTAPRKSAVRRPSHPVAARVRSRGAPSSSSQSGWTATPVRTCDKCVLMVMPETVREGAPGSAVTPTQVRRTPWGVAVGGVGVCWRQLDGGGAAFTGESSVARGHWAPRSRRIWRSDPDPMRAFSTGMLGVDVCDVRWAQRWRLRAWG